MLPGHFHQDSVQELVVGLLEDDGRAPFIGLSQGRAGHLGLPQVIEFGSMLVEAEHQVPETAPASQLPI